MEPALKIPINFSIPIVPESREGVTVTKKIVFASEWLLGSGRHVYALNIKENRLTLKEALASSSKETALKIILLVTIIVPLIAFVFKGLYRVCGGYCRDVISIDPGLNGTIAMHKLKMKVYELNRKQFILSQEESGKKRSEDAEYREQWAYGKSPYTKRIQVAPHPKKHNAGLDFFEVTPDCTFGHLYAALQEKHGGYVFSGRLYNRLEQARERVEVDYAQKLSHVTETLWVDYIKAES